jgi:hypothetical protein
MLSFVEPPPEGTTMILLNRLSPVVITGERLRKNVNVMVGMRVGTGDGPTVVVVVVAVVGYHEGLGL